jgi:hypothetical protein
VPASAAPRSLVRHPEEHQVTEDLMDAGASVGQAETVRSP